MPQLNDLYGVDRTPKVRIELTTHDPKPSVTDRALRDIVTLNFTNITEYSYDSDILNLGDPFAVSIPNPGGIYSGVFQRGDTVRFHIADPDVAGGQEVCRLVGVVTKITSSGSKDAGDRIVVQGADLGWHLNNNCAPLWTQYKQFTFKKILEMVIDRTWGFTGVETDNNANRRINLGRATIAAINVGALAVLPPIQFEPGQMISDVLIPVARRAGVLLNVSADGKAQFFRPDYTTPAMYALYHYKITDEKRIQNNVETYSLDESIDGVYTHVTCVGQVAYTGSGATTGAATNERPNEGKKRGDYFSTSSLPFTRYLTFSDSDQFSKSHATERATWKWQRGQFDSYVLTYTVAGHSQNGFLWTPDTMCQVTDTVLGLDGPYYVSAVRFSRNMTDGTKTTLTLRKPNVLGA